MIVLSGLFLKIEGGSSNASTSEKKRCRPKDLTTQEAFEDVVSHVEDNSGALFTISELAKVMESSDSGEDVCKLNFGMHCLFL